MWYMAQQCHTPLHIKKEKKIRNKSGDGGGAPSERREDQIIGKKEHSLKSCVIWLSPSKGISVTLRALGFLRLICQRS